MAVGALAALALLSGCAPEGSTEPESSTVLTSTSTTHAISTITEPPTTTSEAATTTTEAPRTRIPRFGSAAWVGIEFTIDPDQASGFGAAYVVGEPRQAEVMVDGQATGIWVWQATYETQRLVVVGEGPSPYLTTISEDEETTTSTAPSNPDAIHDLMLWTITGTSRAHWKVTDVLAMQLSAGFLAEYDVWGDCFAGSSGDDLRQRALGWVDNELWNHQFDDEGNYLGADDIRPVMAFATGPNGPIELLDPSIVICQVLY